MVKVYNILNDSENRPVLNVQKKININWKNISIEETVEILNEHFNMKNLSIEHAYLIGFNSKMDIIGVFLVSIGTHNKCNFYQRNIATFLLLSGSERFIVYHNHPNGDLNASSNDNSVLISIQLLAEMLEIEFIESVIISKKGWNCIKRNEVYKYDKKNVF